MPATAAEIERALSLAYRHLNRRERTEQEIRDCLERGGVDAGALEAALAVLRDGGVLDDERFASMFAQDKRELDGWGSERIREALLRRGIAREIVAEAVCEGDRAAEHERALAILRRRFPAPPRDRRDRDRALGVLLRKGYEPELAFDALTRYSSRP